MSNVEFLIEIRSYELQIQKYNWCKENGGENITKGKWSRLCSCCPGLAERMCTQNLFCISDKRSFENLLKKYLNHDSSTRQFLILFRRGKQMAKSCRLFLKPGIFVEPFCLAEFTPREHFDPVLCHFVLVGMWKT